MQKDTVVHNIHTVTLDATRSNKVVSLRGIREVSVDGRELALGGYLDIGIIDTMKDLLVNFVGGRWSFPPRASSTRRARAAPPTPP